MLNAFFILFDSINFDKSEHTDSKGGDQRWLTMK
jgi:hypothetical protein